VAVPTLAHKLRGAVAGLALTTDVIVGFPGESEADFAETLAVCEEVSFDHAFTFIYSPRRGTDAARMDEQIGEDVKRERLERLVEVIQRHAHARTARRYLDAEVLVEGSSRTAADVMRSAHPHQQDGAAGERRARRVSCPCASTPPTSRDAARHARAFPRRSDGRGHLSARLPGKSALSLALARHAIRRDRERGFDAVF
jgi:tRNA-2-methylthio-N6-dimethylallyladenosine synthase